MQLLSKTESFARNLDYTVKCGKRALDVTGDSKVWETIDGEPRGAITGLQVDAGGVWRQGLVAEKSACDWPLGNCWHFPIIKQLCQ